MASAATLNAPGDAILGRLFAILQSADHITVLFNSHLILLVQRNPISQHVNTNAVFQRPNSANGTAHGANARQSSTGPEGFAFFAGKLNIVLNTQYCFEPAVFARLTNLLLSFPTCNFSENYTGVREASNGIASSESVAVCGSH